MRPKDVLKQSRVVVKKTLIRQEIVLRSKKRMHNIPLCIVDIAAFEKEAMRRELLDYIYGDVRADLIHIFREIQRGDRVRAMEGMEKLIKELE